MLRNWVILLSLLIGVNLAAAEIKPFKTGNKANSLIIRGRFKENADYKKLPVLDAALTDGSFRHSGPARIINPVAGNKEVDFEFPLDTIRQLTTGCSIAISNQPDGMEIYEILPVVFRTDDLSRGLDFESADKCGTWITNLGGKAEWDRNRSSRGRGSMKAAWRGNQMVSLLPGERDWTPYVELRFVVSNPLPGIQGRRNRNMFLFDGKTVYRPTAKDSIPEGRLDVMQESSKVFKLDLARLKENHPEIDLKNMMSIQIYWSSTKAPGETVFYFDDIQLLTAEDLETEKAVVYLNKFKELEKWATTVKKRDWSTDIRALQKRFQSGERESLDPEITALKEKLVNAAILGDAELRIVAVNPADKVMRDTMFRFDNFPVGISAAGNERESFQLVVATSGPLKQLKIDAGELRNAAGQVIPADCVRINPIGYVEVTEAFYYPSSRIGFWPDILHQNHPFDLPERVQPFMVTVAVPAGQAAGVYEGTLTVAAENLETRNVQYKLQVYDFSLPVRGKAKTFIHFSYVPNDRELRRKVYETVFDYRLNPTSMYPKFFKKKVHTRFLPDPEDLAYCLEKGMNFMCFGFLEDKLAKDSFSFDDEYIKAVVEWIDKWKPVLEKHNAWDIAYLLGFDEIMHQPGPVRDQRLREAEKICRAIKSAYPDCRISNIGRLMSIAPELMDKWYAVPVKNKEFTNLLKQGKEVGFYWAYQNPSFMLDQPGIAPRICSWMAYKEGADGIGYYSSTKLHGSCTELNKPSLERQRRAHNNTVGFGICTEDCTPDPMPVTLDWDKSQYNLLTFGGFARNADGMLFYPAPDHTLLASFRLLSIRDGIEDFEYLKILEELSGGKHPLLKIPDSLVTLESYTQNYNELRTHRDKVARAIEQLKR